MIPRHSRSLTAYASLLCILAIASPAQAQDASATFDWQQGGVWADIGVNLAEISLSDQYVYLDGDDTRSLMEYLENPVSEQEVATITPANGEEFWFLVFEWDPLGYVEVDDREDLDADAILRSLRKATDAANEVRRQRGWEPLNLIGWKTPPFYDPRTNNLTWATVGESGGEEILNRNIRLLGRKGVMRVTLVAAPAEYRYAVAAADRLLENYRFTPGNGYGEYVAGKDRVAEIGLAALITGGAATAAVKTGLFARLWKFLAAGVIALFAGLKGMFARLGGSGRRS